MLSRRRLFVVTVTALLLLATLACQPAGPAGSTNAVNALETGLSDAPESVVEAEIPADPDAAVSSDSDFGEVDAVDDPFGVIGPAFQSLGFQSHTATCDPFDEEYGTCL